MMVSTVSMTFTERLDEHCRSIGIAGLTEAALENEGEQAKARIGHWLCEVGFFGWPNPDPEPKP